MAFVLALTLGVLAPSRVAAQVARPPGPTADFRDVATADAVLPAVYDVIWGPRPETELGERIRSLFLPGARLRSTGVGHEKKARIRVMTPDEYAAVSGPRLEESGLFFESEIGRTTDTFGNVTHAFSAYESKRSAAADNPFARGINSIQFFSDGARWWVVSVYWDSGRGDNPIPAKYLKPRS